jgi:hypothetical protein
MTLTQQGQTLTFRAGQRFDVPAGAPLRPHGA